MNFFKKTPSDSSWISKGSGAIVTIPGYSEHIIDVIKEIDLFEYTDYGLVNGDFIVPIYETLERISDTDNFIVPDVSLEYYGKFDLDLDKFYSFCKQRNIPVFVLSEIGGE